ncbi:hypothetical protein [Yersinia enterocolitica]|uniref:hypothetical protein n=1 Tax=Yersinia enterocolitica TaxID=630 RepID=UPI0032FC391E|nr:hypothetical protein [Yersinia enterocolitica]
MKYLYVVMDSRAQSDIDRAMILECCGNKKPSWKSLSETWGQQGAVLVRCRESKSQGENTYTDEEVVGVIN